jgi:DNA repair protein RecO (recombination protein O)
MIKVEAIVLRTIDYGETHKILTLYSAQMGKIAALARGAKKPKSEMAAVSQPFTYGAFLLYIGERQGMGTVSQAEVIDSFRAIREDLIKAAYASYIVELTDRFTAEREPSPAVFLLLYTMLHYLTEEDKDPEVLVRLFETKMLDIAGIRPELYHCAHCFKPLQQSIRFSILHGGPLCSDCHPHDERAVWMKPVTLKLMQTFQEMDVRRLGQTRVGDDVKRQLNKILRQYLDEYGGVQLRSRAFLDQLDRYEF